MYGRLGTDIFGPEKNYRPMGSSIKNGVKMEFRLYYTKKEAMTAAMKLSKGTTPIHHKPHKTGDYYHFHVSCHTMTNRGRKNNIHFMYGPKL